MRIYTKIVMDWSGNMLESEGFEYDGPVAQCGPALIPAAAAIGGALIGSKASKDAASTQARAAESAAEAQLTAAREANALQERIYNQNREDMAPWRAAGVNALGGLSAGLAPGGDFSRAFTMADFQQDPGYEFRMNEGLRALRNAASARRMGRSPASSMALTRYAQDYASGEFGRAFDRYQADLGGRYNRLAGVAGTGQQATSQIGAYGSNFANQAGANITGAAAGAANAGLAGANARASGYVGGANALAGGLSNLANYYQQNQLLNRFSGGGLGYGTADPTQAGSGYPY